jgi:hypothetical protein
MVSYTACAGFGKEKKYPYLTRDYSTSLGVQLGVQGDVFLSFSLHLFSTLQSLLIPFHSFFFFSLSPSFHFSHSFFVLYFAGVLPLIFISSLSLLYFLCSPDSMPCHGDPADVTVEYHTILE